MLQDLQKFNTVLVCGGSGFIGSNFIRHFYHKHPDSTIVNFDLLTYAGNPDNLLDIEKLEEARGQSDRRYHFVQGDICDESQLEKLFKKYEPDLVINFAAESHVDRSIISSYDFIRTNVEGARSLIEAIQRFNVPRFVQISTDEVYGNIPDGYSNEDFPFRPSSPYAASKAAADLLVQSYIRTYKAPAIIIRGSNNFGSYQYPEKLIPLAITNILEGKKVPVHGTGEHIRSWLHVLDFCSAIDLVVSGAQDHSIYNVSGDERSNIQVLQAIADCIGKDLHEHKEHVGDRPGADFRYAPDSSKIKEELGWEQEYNFNDSIGSLVSWYADNPIWWQKIKKEKEFQVYYEKQSKAQYY